MKRETRTTVTKSRKNIKVEHRESGKNSRLRKRENGKIQIRPKTVKDIKKRGETNREIRVKQVKNEKADSGRTHTTKRRKSG